MLSTAPAEVMHHLPQCLSLLRPLVSGRGTLDDALVDNACSGVSKILMAIVLVVGENGLPLLPASQISLTLGQVLPVLLSALPIKNDHEEDKSVYIDCLGALLSMGAIATSGINQQGSNAEICRGELVKILPQIVTVLVKAMPMADVPEVREGIIHALRAATSRYGVPAQQLVSGLTQDEAKWLQSVV